jgi:hypothetical protein
MSAANQGQPSRTLTDQIKLGPSNLRCKTFASSHEGVNYAFRVPLPLLCKLQRAVHERGDLHNYVRC